MPDFACDDCMDEGCDICAEADDFIIAPLCSYCNDVRCGDTHMCWEAYLEHLEQAAEEQDEIHRLKSAEIDRANEWLEENP